MFSKIIRNANILDGSGSKAYRSDIAIEEDKIVQIGNLAKAKAQESIDAQGKYVTPGFVDIQNHSDVYWTLFDSPSLDSLVAQGITTALIGSCGASLAPLLSRDALLSVQKWHNLEGVNFNWVSFKDYLDELSKRRFGVNLASLVGYSTLRRGLLGEDVRELKDDELKIMTTEIEKAIAGGAFGLSSGLSYAHERVIPKEELFAIAQKVKEAEALFSLHLRSEGVGLIESVAEAIELVEKLEVNLKISHFKARDKANWHLLPEALGMIEKTYQAHGNLHFDTYPYDFVWQVLYTYLPPWSYEGGRGELMHHLKDPIERRKVLSYLNSKDIDYSAIVIASTAMALNVVGKTLGEVASRNNISSQQALMTLVENGGSEILVFEQNLDWSQVEKLITHPLGMIATDGAGFSIGKRKDLVHPRAFGSMPKFLSLVFEKNICPLETAIQKMTSIPANKIGLKNRGLVAVDYHADLVIMDFTVKSRASMLNPYQYPQGIDYVLVNGKKVVEHGEVLDLLAGKILRK